MVSFFQLLILISVSFFLFGDVPKKIKEITTIIGIFKEGATKIKKHSL